MTSAHLRLRSLSNCRTLYLRRFAEILREEPEIPAAAIEAAIEGAGSFFDDIVATDKGVNFAKKVKGLTSSCLTLVSDEDLALSIRLDSLAAHLFDSTSGGLWKPYLRFTNLLDRPDLPKDDNPIGPQGIVNGLEKMFEFIGASIAADERHELIDRLEALLIERLPGIYSELDAVLADEGIEAGQANIITAPGAGSNRALAQGDVVSTLASLNQALVARLSASGGGSGSGSGGTGGGSGGGGTAQGRPEVPTFVQLRDRLNAMDGDVLEDEDDADDAHELEALIPGLFDKKDKKNKKKTDEKISAATLGLPPGAPEGMLVDMLSAIFDALDTNQQLPVILRKLLRSLRITLIKQALQEKQPFGSPESPCRMLLDGLGNLFRSIPLEAGEAHPICAKCLEIARRLRERFDVAPGAFIRALAELEALKTERDAAIAAQTAVFQPVLEYRERTDRAHVAVRALMQSAKTENLPEELAFFVEDVWKPILVQICLRHGVQSQEWQEYSHLSDDLAQALQPMTEASEYSLRSARVPQLLKLLRTGMELTDMAPETQSQVLNICFALLARATRPKNAPPLALPKIPPASKPVNPREIQLITLRMQEPALKCVDYRDFGQPVPAQMSCRRGDWLLLNIGRRKHCFCVADVEPGAPRVLLLNPDIEPPLAIHASILEAQLRQGEAQVLPVDSLFETAATQALKDFQS